MMKRGREEGECLMLLTKVGESETNKNPIISNGDFKCKTCNRRFSSFQALGGHRASHKRPKLMVKDLGYLLQSPTMKQPSRMKHPCPICGVEFGIGQALGGHMRKHRSTATVNDRARDSSDHHHSFSIFKNSKQGQRLNFLFDLNLTPLDDDDLKLNLNCFI